MYTVLQLYLEWFKYMQRDGGIVFHSLNNTAEFILIENFVASLHCHMMHLLQLLSGHQLCHIN